MNKPNKVVVIGASMGGQEVLSKIIGNLPVIPIPICIVQHVSESAPPLLPYILSKKSEWKVKLAENDMPLENGVIYVSTNHQHLIIEDHHLTLGEGPHQNSSRPSINVLFSSAAIHFRENTIGILLTGLLSDGVIGLKSIKQIGGTTIVQDPEDAPYKEMPNNAIREVDIDYVAAAEDIPALLKILLKKEISSKNIEPSEKMISLVKRSRFSLRKENWHINPNHSITIADSIYATIQILQERVTMYENLTEKNLLKGNHLLARKHHDQSLELKVHVQNLHKYLHQVSSSVS